MHRLVCAFVVRKPPKTGFFATRPNYEGLPVGFLLIGYAAYIYNNVLLSSCLCFISFFYLDLYVLGDDA